VAVDGLVVAEPDLLRDLLGDVAADEVVRARHLVRQASHVRFALAPALDHVGDETEPDERDGQRQAAETGHPRARQVAVAPRRRRQQRGVRYPSESLRHAGGREQAQKRSGSEHDWQLTEDDETGGCARQRNRRGIATRVRPQEVTEEPEADRVELCRCMHQPGRRGTPAQHARQNQNG